MILRPTQYRVVLVVHTTIPLDPARRDDAMDRIAALVESSRAEPGTVRYWAATDVTDPDLVRFVEQYEDAAAVEEHHATAAYRTFIETLPDLVDGDIETVQFETDTVHDVAFSAADAVASLE